MVIPNVKTKIYTLKKCCSPTLYYARMLNFDMLSHSLPAIPLCRTLIPQLWINPLPLPGGRDDS